MANRNGMWSATFDTARFNRNIRRLHADMRTETGNVLKKSANNFETQLGKNANKLTGALVGTITHTDTSSGDKLERTVSIGGGLAYAIPLEHGHVQGGRYVQGQRFFIPLAKVYNRRFKGAIRRAMRKLFRRFQ